MALRGLLEIETLATAPLRKRAKRAVHPLQQQRALPRSSAPSMVQRKAGHGAFGFVKDCIEACCDPDGRKRAVNETRPLPSDSRHAFLQHEYCAKLPRDVLLRIFTLAATVERRVVTVNEMKKDRWQKVSEPEMSMAFAGMCMEDDDAPP